VTDLEVGWASSVAIRVKVGREPSIATIGGGVMNSVASSIGGGGVTMGYPRSGCGRRPRRRQRATLKAAVWSPPSEAVMRQPQGRWRSHLGIGGMEKIFSHDLRSTNVTLQQRRTRSHVTTSRA
jgi:hypothetical protein